MRATALTQAIFGLLLVTMSMEVQAQPPPAEVDPAAEALLDEEDIFRKAGFDEQTSVLLGGCPFHTAFASRVDLLQQIKRPLESDKVRRVNEDVRRCLDTKWSRTESCTEILCMSLIDVFELPVTRRMSQRALAIKRQENDVKRREEDQNAATVGGVFILLFTLAAVAMERRWRNQQRR